MIGLEDRRSLAQDIDIANTAGARLHLACSTAGIDLRTLQRWKGLPRVYKQEMAGPARCIRRPAMR